MQISCSKKLTELYDIEDVDVCDRFDKSSLFRWYISESNTRMMTLKTYIFRSGKGRRSYES